MKQATSIREKAVLGLFKKGRISSGYATELLDVGLVEFMELLNRKNMSFSSYNNEDWEQDKKAVKEMMKLSK